MSAFTATSRSSPPAPSREASCSSAVPSAPVPNMDRAITVDAGEVTSVSPGKAAITSSPSVRVDVTTRPTPSVSAGLGEDVGVGDVLAASVASTVGVMSELLALEQPATARLTAAIADTMRQREPFITLASP